MKSILEELWYGEIHPMELNPHINKDVNELAKLIDTNRNKLSERLKESDRDILDAYDCCIDEMHNIIEREQFIYAFRLGGRIMAETLFSDERT
ncbi:MAG: hypothetical protein IJ391_01935 [Clostridia bacterium]|nr:hypothetical protein [Clostridia bacterium]